ncbi:MAG: hypothetical protein ABIP20_10330 [Chthoniobacteraceae bacterium]
MNDPITEPVPNAAAKCCQDVEQRIRQNPGTTLLIAIGTGLAIGLLVRALRPERTPQYRVARMLEDIQQRMRDATAPALHKAGELASEGAEAVRDGWHNGEARLGSLVREGRNRLTRFFSKS